MRAKENIRRILTMMIFIRKHLRISFIYFKIKFINLWCVHSRFFHLSTQLLTLCGAPLSNQRAYNYWNKYWKSAITIIIYSRFNPSAPTTTKTKNLKKNAKTTKRIQKWKYLLFTLTKTEQEKKDSIKRYENKSVRVYRKIKLILLKLIWYGLFALDFIFIYLSMLCSCSLSLSISNDLTIYSIAS